MLAGRLPNTAPYGWDGAGNDPSHHLDHTIARLEGAGFAPKERAAVLRYISTLPGPDTQRAAPPETLEHGQAVFLTAGCASCHALEGGWTDGKSHNVSSRVAADAVAAFDTPSLRFVGGTAPYFHDGRYPTLRDLLTRSEGPMGAARKMPAEDIDALESFVRSL
jgi:mono/diheme cytochrome c family protein